MNIELIKLHFVSNSNLRPRGLEPCTLPARPRTLNNRQTLVTNKAATYANKMPMRCSKKGSNTNRHNLACNNLEYNKLKTFMLALHVIN